MFNLIKNTDLQYFIKAGALFFLILFFGIQSSLAQDVILKRDGSEVKALVKEVGDDVIKYQKFDNQTGPLYSIKKSDVFMITYQNGSKDVFKEEGSKSENSEKPDSESEEKKEDPDKERIDAVASNVYSQIINCCSGRKENARFEIFYDAVIKNEETGEIKVPIRVSWQGSFESNRWVKGTAILKSNNQLGWIYQADSGGLGMGCAKRCQVK
jgi:hypothetical protein